MGTRACFDPLRSGDGAGYMLQQPAHIRTCTAAAAVPGRTASGSTLQALVARHGGVRCREAGPSYCLENAPVSEWLTWPSRLTEFDARLLL